MPHSLRISDGLTSISLTNINTSLLMDYVPNMPDIEMQRSVAGSHGEAIPQVRFRNVTESVRCTLVGADSEALEVSVWNLEKMFRDAEEHQRTGMMRRIFVFMHMTGLNEWRSEILTGRVVLADTAWRLWANNQVEVIITWTRRYYWERLAGGVFMSGLGFSRGTGGINIRNCFDATRGNYVDILADDAISMLPAALKLSMQNLEGAQNFSNFYIGTYVEWPFRSASTFDPVLEGEESSIGTAQNDSTCSGGQFMPVSWGTGSGNILARWTISLVQLSVMAGGSFRLLVRWRGTVPNGTYMRARLGWPTGSPILVPMAETSEVLVSASRLQDLGVLRIPPQDVTAAETADQFAPLNLELLLRATSSGSSGIDFLFLMPMDEYRHIRTLGGSFPTNHSIVDDGRSGYLYAVSSGGEKFPLLTGFGEPIRLIAGRKQRIFFLWDTTITHNVDHRLRITGEYARRSLSI